MAEWWAKIMGRIQEIGWPAAWGPEWGPTEWAGVVQAIFTVIGVFVAWFVARWAVQRTLAQNAEHHQLDLQQVALDRQLEERRWRAERLDTVATQLTDRVSALSAATMAVRIEASRDAPLSKSQVRDHWRTRSGSAYMTIAELELQREALQLRTLLQSVRAAAGSTPSTGVQVRPVDRAIDYVEDLANLALDIATTGLQAEAVARFGGWLERGVDDLAKVAGGEHHVGNKVARLVYAAEQNMPDDRPLSETDNPLNVAKRLLDGEGQPEAHDGRLWAAALIPVVAPSIIEEAAGRLRKLLDDPQLSPELSDSNGLRGVEHVGEPIR